jgi:hypothetical protein
MIWLINFIKKRPSDKTILLSRIVFWLILSWSLYYNLIFLNKWLDTNFFWIDVSESTVLYIKYFFISLWFVPIIVWITNVCLFKSLKIRILQIVYWILLFYISSKIQESPNLDIDVLIWFMWLFPLFAWITWKCITKKCLNYWYKIEKIRV